MLGTMADGSRSEMISSAQKAIDAHGFHERQHSPRGLHLRDAGHAALAIQRDREFAIHKRHRPDRGVGGGCHPDGLAAVQHLMVSVGEGATG